MWTSRFELDQALRLHGCGALDDVRAAVLERNGSVSVVTVGTRVDADVFGEMCRSGLLERS